MKTGDTVRDDQDRSYKVGLLLGRGTWGMTWRLTRDSDGADLLAKVPLTEADFPPETSELERIAEECREIMLEQAGLLREGSYPFLPALVAEIDQEHGGPAIITERFPVSLEQRLLAGCSFGEALGILLQVGRVCQQLRDGPGIHGALKPSNILLDAEGGVRLTDVVTPAARRVFPRLVAAAPGACMLPPEIRDASGEPPFSTIADTYALGRLVWQAVMGGEGAPDFPQHGLDKAALVVLKDRLHARIKQEDSNPRFHSRLADRLSTTLSRAVSVKASPSPPYRFDRMDELNGRLEELHSLIRPEVVTVGRGLLDRPPNTTHFETDEPVVFSVSVGCSPGVERHEEIGCGVAVIDRETGDRVREVPSTFDVSRHPSGRFRFLFRLSGLRPGSYRARVAFAIRDSGHEPQAGEVEFEVRAAYGWEPSPESPPAAALPMRSFVEEGVTVTSPMAPVPATAPPPPAPAPPAPAPQVTVPKPAPLPKPAVVVPKPAPPPKPDVVAPRPTPRPAVVAPKPSPVPAPAPATVVPPKASTPTVVPSAPGPRTASGPRVAVASPKAAEPGKPEAWEPLPTQAAVRGDTLPARDHDTAVPLDSESQPAAEPGAGAAPGGTWLDLPVAPAGGKDLDELPEDLEDLDEFRPRPAWRQIVDMIRGDAWSMLMVGGAVILVLLLILIMLLKG